MIGLARGLLKSLVRLSAFVGKEFVDVARRPSVLIGLILGPFLIMALFGLGYDGQPRALKSVLVVPENSDLPRERAFYEEYLGQSIDLVDIQPDPGTARDALQQREIDLIIIAPPNAEQSFLDGRQSTITVEYNQIDPIRDNYARFVIERQISELNRAIVERAIATGKQYALLDPRSQAISHIPPEVAAAPTVALPRNWAPIEPAVIVFFAPAVLALILQHLGISLTALSIVRERVSGAMDIFRVSPVHTLEILIGKYLAYGFFNLVIAGIIALLMIGPLDIPLLGDPLVFIGVVALLTFASLGLGLFISAVVDSERQAVQMSMIVLLASVFFGGLVLPLDEFRDWMRIGAYALPVTHGISLLQDTMLRGEIIASWHVWALAAIGGLLFLLSSFALKRSLRQA